LIPTVSSAAMITTQNRTAYATSPRNFRSEMSILLWSITRSSARRIIRAIQRPTRKTTTANRILIPIGSR
jgi:hypothetical protein